MTYSDMTAQSPETQAAVEHEVRVLLKVCVHLFWTAEQKKPSKAASLPSFILWSPGVLRTCQSPAEVPCQRAQKPGRCSAHV